MFQKIRTFIRFIVSPQVSKRFIVRYALGQLLAYSGIGRYLSFPTPYYKLYLTKSPVAMVLFGNPMQVRDEEGVLGSLLRIGDTVVDIGANIGTFSLRAALHVGSEGHVFACEAHPHTASILERNMQLNVAESVTVLKCAVGDKGGEVSFTTGAYDDVNHVTKEGSLQVPVVPLDEIVALQHTPRIRCIKIDVEGYELQVLHGGENTLKKTDYVIFEAYEPNCVRFGYKLDALYDWFETRGFLLFELDQKTPIDRKIAGRLEVHNLIAVSQSR